MAGTDQGMEVRMYRVEGRVQGVGFRWWTRKTAQGLGLLGRVRNEADGSVHVRVMGPAEALEALEEALWRGPQLAQVRSVRRSEEDGEVPTDEWDGFEIERG